LPYKDKDKARTYQREYQRRRRSGSRVGLTDQGLTCRFETLNDLRIVLEHITSEVHNTEDLDVGVKGRITAQLLTVGIRLVEGTDLERRIKALENRQSKATEL
jgi:hypothetical protein